MADKILFFLNSDSRVDGERYFSGDDATTPRRKYRKGVLRLGTWVHPKAGWTLPVTEDRMSHLLSAFGQMKANGVDVEMVKNHGRLAEDVIGYTLGFERNGDWLDAVLEARGEEGINLAEVCRGVSVLIDKDFKDGKGNSYGEAITHVSISQAPVITGQSDFQRIAASLNADDYVPQEESVMPKELLDLIRKMTGKAELSDADALTALTEYHTAHTTIAASLTEKDAKIGELELAVKDIKKPVTIDPEALDTLVEGTEMELSALVTTGKVTPAVKDKLTAILVGPADKRNTYFLSRTVSGTTVSLAKAIIAALKENDIVKLGEQTGKQVIALSRNVDGSEADAPTVEDAKEIKRRAKAIAKAAGAEIKE